MARPPIAKPLILVLYMNVSIMWVLRSLTNKLLQIFSILKIRPISKYKIMIMTSILKWQVNPFLSYFLKYIFQLIVTNNVCRQGSVFGWKIESHPHVLWTVHIKKLTNDLAALHMLIQPLVYQVQCIFCVWLKHISLIQSTPESLIQKSSLPKILAIYRNLSTLVICKIMTWHLQNIPLKRVLSSLKEPFYNLHVFLCYLERICPQIFKSLFHLKN